MYSNYYLSKTRRSARWLRCFRLTLGALLLLVLLSGSIFSSSLELKDATGVALTQMKGSLDMGSLSCAGAPTDCSSPPMLVQHRTVSIVTKCGDPLGELSVLPRRSVSGPVGFWGTLRQVNRFMKTEYGRSVRFVKEDESIKTF